MQVKERRWTGQDPVLEVYGQLSNYKGYTGQVKYKADMLQISRKKGRLTHSHWTDLSKVQYFCHLKIIGGIRLDLTDSR